jgi:hypothetical protein
MSSRREKLVRAAGLEDYFRTEVRAAISNQKVQASPHTEFYLVRMLADFSRVSALYEAHEHRETPLAIRYLQSLQAGRQEAFRMLKQLGDVALYISGFFQDSLNRRQVDLEYYISMGGNAYHRLSSLSRQHSIAESFEETFSELAARFVQYVDVLGEVSEKSQLFNASDLLRLYERWLSTGSERLKRKLNDHGIFPHSFSKPETAH